MTLSATTIERFWKHVQKTETCWLWTGSKSKLGYGYFGIEGKNRKPHRISWIIAHGELADDLVIDHLCRIPSCVNPAHLEPVTTRVNVLRGISPFANKAKQTHCKNGHPLSGDNLGKYPAHDHRRHGRFCKTCQLRLVREWKKKRRPVSL